MEEITKEVLSDITYYSHTNSRGNTTTIFTMMGTTFVMVNKSPVTALVDLKKISKQVKTILVFIASELVDAIKEEKLKKMEEKSKIEKHELSTGVNGNGEVVNYCTHCYTIINSNVNWLHAYNKNTDYVWHECDSLKPHGYNNGNKESIHVNYSNDTDVISWVRI